MSSPIRSGFHASCFASGRVALCDEFATGGGVAEELLSWLGVVEFGTASVDDVSPVVVVLVSFGSCVTKLEDSSAFDVF